MRVLLIESLKRFLVAIKEQIAEVKSVPNVTQAILKEYARITTEFNNVREANKNFKKLEELKKTAKEYADTRDKVTFTQLSEIEWAINQKMREISTRILKNEIQRAPELTLKNLITTHLVQRMMEEAEHSSEDLLLLT